MKKYLILLERDSFAEITEIRQLLEENSINFTYYPAVEENIVKETKSFYQSLLAKLKW